MSDVLVPVSETPELTEAVLAQSAANVVRDLAEILTKSVVALLTDVSATRLVTGWEHGAALTPRREQAVRAALQAARVLETRFGQEVVRSWFVGLNRRLGDRAPTEVLRTVAVGAGGIDAARDVLNAARAFISR